MQSLRVYARQWPRTAGALAFGVTAAAVTHFAWFPNARMSGYAPVLTVGAGVAHALAGAFTGPSIVSPRRALTAARAALLGAATSLAAVALIAPPLAAWVTTDNAKPVGIASYLVLTVLVGLFSFLAVGWALLLVSAVVGWGLFRLTTFPSVAGTKGGG